MSIINNICEHGQLERKCDVCELKAEIARLRRVCRSSEMCIMLATSEHVTARERVQMLNCVRKDLADAGKEPSDGK